MTIKINELIIRAKIERQDTVKENSVEQTNNNTEDGKTTEIVSLNKINRER
ncbi:MAG: hypothetical protein Q4A56_04015 [Porphyromonadaceae bacterium]|nr:hypothetical protein [Porphyromonadaceae bacterium]